MITFNLKCLKPRFAVQSMLSAPGKIPKKFPEANHLLRLIFILIISLPIFSFGVTLSDVLGNVRWGGNNLSQSGTLGTSSNQSVAIKTNNTVRMTIDTLGMITVTGTLNANALCIAGSCQTSWPSGSGIAATSGTASYVPKFANAGTLANSQIFDNGTNVGIGITTPSNKLTVGDDSNGAVSSGNSIVIGNASGNSAIGVGQSSTVRGRMLWNYNATTANAYLSFGTAATTNALVLQDVGGSVGIGTTGPIHKLHIVSTAAEDGLIVDAPSYPEVRFDRSAVTKGYIGIAGTANGFATNSLVDSLVIRSENAVHLGPGGSVALTATTGSIGIGTTAPTGLLNVMGAFGLPPTTGTSTTYNLLRLNNTSGGATGAVLDFGQDGVVGGWIQSRSGGDYSVNYPLILNPNGGNVVINGSSTNASLQVSKNTGNYASFMVGYDSGLSGAGATSYNGYQVQAWTDGNMYIDAKVATNGTVNYRTGQGTEAGWTRTYMSIQSSTANITFGGQLYAPAYFYTSDRRLKENIETYKNGLETVLALRGVKFNWIKDGTPEMGLIAQEVEQVAPELVTTDATTGFKAVKYGNLVAPLIESTKSLYGMSQMSQKQIQEINERLAKVEHRVSSVEDTVSEQQKMIKNQQKQIEFLRKEVELLKKRK